MRFRISSAVVALLAMSSQAQAQWVVVDPALNKTALAQFAKQAMVEIHAAQEVINTGQTVMNTIGILNSVAHGNVMELARLMPLMQSAKLSNPFGIDTGGIAGLMSGIEDVAGVGGEVMNLWGQAQAMTTLYSPSGNDYAAQMMMQRARSAAGQLAVATRSLDSSKDRLVAMPGLLAGTENTATLKGAVDANNTLAGQQLTATSQTNQLLALQLYQRAEIEAQKGREEQEWRRGADTLVSEATAAATAAKAGRVQLVHGN